MLSPFVLHNSFVTKNFIINNNNSFTHSIKKYFILVIFSLLIIGFESCTNESNNFTLEEADIKTRNNNDDAKYQEIGSKFSSIVERYNNAFNADIHLKNIDNVVTIDLEILETELGQAITLEQEHEIHDINDDIRLLIDLLNEAIEINEDLTVRDLEDISLLWLRLSFPDIDFENLENNTDRYPECPCRTKYDNCSVYSWGVYMLGMTACAGTGICPPCALACLTLNGLNLYNNMEDCDGNYHDCLYESDC